MNKMKIFFLLVISAFCGAAAALLLQHVLLRPAEPKRNVSPASAEQNQESALDHEFFSRAVERAMPGVVQIAAQRIIGVLRPDIDYNRNRRIDYMEVPSGQGSGFFIRADGHILTNYHVVRGQDSFWVTTHDGREFPAQVIGIDPPTDLAVLKIKSDEKLTFPVLEFADPKSLKIGHWAIAIGAPFNLSRTVTIGVVSSKKRNGVGVNLHENYVQTDAPVNPGNSGGPLLDIHGKVIGVNDFILSPSGGSIGLSFAISSEIAERVSGDLLDKGYVERPWLGVTIGAVNREIRQKYGITGGVVIGNIYRNSPAAGKLEPGDIVLKINGVEVSSPSDLQSRVFSSHAGSKLTLEILRSGRIKRLTIMVEKSPRQDKLL